MESCTAVEQDMDKALTKFNGIQNHAERLLSESVKNLEDLNKEIAQIDPDTSLTPDQAQMVKESVERVKEAILQLATEHRDLHVNVSRIGKSIDRHFVTDYPTVAPRAASFCSKTNKPIMEQAVAHHFYRQGLDEVGDVFVREAQVLGVESQSPFATVERIAASLLAGETEPALNWVAKRQDELMHSTLPFTLHTMHAIKLAREVGLPEAIAYAREHFPPFAARHESQLQAAVCALMWCTPYDRNAKYTAPDQYRHLLTPKILGVSTSELFVQEACSLLKLAPLSALASAVRAGCRVHPPLLEMRAKVTQQHVIDAWAGDELPLQVEMGSSEGCYHSVFACPILRQQASEQNPPMRLLCGHVISRDALNKLAQGLKLKCPYCPMEQPPTEARQIYFT